MDNFLDIYIYKNHKIKNKKEMFIMNNVITQARDNNGDFRGLIIDPKWFNLFDSKNYSIEPNNEVYRHVGLNTNYDLVLTFIDKQDKRPVSYFEIINNYTLYNNSTFAYDILKNLSLSNFTHPIFNEDGEITNASEILKVDVNDIFSVLNYVISESENSNNINVVVTSWRNENFIKFPIAKNITISFKYDIVTHLLSKISINAGIQHGNFYYNDTETIKKRNLIACKLINKWINS